MERGAGPIIPPGINAVEREGASEIIARNAAIRGVNEHGRKYWAKKVGHHTGRLIETMMSRLNGIGDKFGAREFSRQVTEIEIGCALPDLHASFGMPKRAAGKSRGLTGIIRAGKPEPIRLKRESAENLGIAGFPKVNTMPYFRQFPPCSS